MANSFSVKDFGAVGDGHTDDTLALQAAIDAASAAGGGTVVIPSGTYIVSAQASGNALILKDNVQLEGDATDRATLKLASGSSADIDGILRADGDAVGVSNLVIDGNRAHTTGVVSDLSLGDGVQLTLNYVQATNASGYGLDLRAEGSQVQANKAYVDYNGQGGVITAGLVGSALNDLIVRDNDGNGLTTQGVVTVQDINSTSNQGYGVAVEGDANGHAAQLISGSISSNRTSGVLIDKASDAVVDHLSISYNTLSAIEVRDSQGTQISTNRIDGSYLDANQPYVLLQDSSGTEVRGNVIGATGYYDGAKSTYGVEERGQSDANRIADNFISNVTEREVKVVGTATAVFDNTDVLTTYGSSGDDVISEYAQAYNTVLYGGAGDDLIQGGVLDNVLIGGAGVDQLAGAQGHDTFRFTQLTDSYRTASASYTDTITAFDASKDSIDVTSLGMSGLGNGHNGTLDLAYNADKNLTYLKSYDADAQGQRFELILNGDYRTSLTADNFLPLTAGTSGDDSLHGTTHGRDTLVGGDGRDMLSGRGDDDRLDGGAGADRLIGGQGADTFVYNQLTDSQVDAAGKNQGRDLIVDFNSGDHDRIDISALGFTGFGDGYGTTLSLTYDSANDITRLSSKELDSAGNRFQIALSGNHVLDLGANAVEFAHADSPQKTSTYPGQILTIGTAANDRLIGSADADRLYGLDGDDVLQGGANNDFLLGGHGADKLTGGSGSDYFVFQSVEDSYRTAEQSHTDLITDFNQGYDSLSVSALGYTDIGDGYNGTLKIDYNATLDRTYVRDLQSDDQGRFFQIALSGDQTQHLRYNNMGFADRDVSTDAAPIEVVGVATHTDHAVG
ncbi:MULTISPECIES: M10 family metallopeptidase C-terminal domain-containing protein [Pseudomonas]|jgi:hypothetical protein|uniref:Uncharacterized protein n=1 Tax=Pseudomonas graminis TaxID=158627 RepID=A0A1C2EFX4_9PSED|nr:MULTISPECIES: glycosyl hydrolase family 28-related protein [Pseudomonas]MBD8710205.1 right-handed parallel beta-helix repeat-containing protein [Pseudomonas sp. CFBP 13711]MBD8715493.1 right-handed parallel beta-helix repeat-containing protein [Pseudomonas sp. CFBP 13715]OCX25873.1 hypothetical protein BBI10_00580 [Pseudomonas graminis]